MRSALHRVAEFIGLARTSFPPAAPAPEVPRLSALDELNRLTWQSAHRRKGLTPDPSVEVPTYYSDGDNWALNEAVQAWISLQGGNLKPVPVELKSVFVLAAYRGRNLIIATETDISQEPPREFFEMCAVVRIPPRIVRSFANFREWFDGLEFTPGYVPTALDELNARAAEVAAEQGKEPELFSDESDAALARAIRQLIWFCGGQTIPSAPELTSLVFGVFASKPIVIAAQVIPDTRLSPELSRIVEKYGALSLVAQNFAEAKDWLDSLAEGGAS